MSHSFGASIQLPVDEKALAKSVDPDWRANWKVILLLKSGLREPFRPIITTKDDKRYTTFLAIETRMFTMRVGPDPVDVQLLGQSDQFSLCDTYDLQDDCANLILTQESMRSFIKTAGYDVTHV